MGMSHCFEILNFKNVAQTGVYNFYLSTFLAGNVLYVEQSLIVRQIKISTTLNLNISQTIQEDFLT